MDNSQDLAVSYPFISTCDCCLDDDKKFVRLDAIMGSLCEQCEIELEREWEEDHYEYLRDQHYDWIDEVCDEEWSKVRRNIDWQNSVGVLYDVQDKLSGFREDRNAARSTREFYSPFLPGEWQAVEVTCPF